jgi:UDP-N-acetylglucosamine transferase subunit ALG13
MIFVIFGNVPIPFQRLAEKINEISGRSTNRFIIQKGYTEHPFPNAQARGFFPSRKMARHISEADLIVSHGGFGSISEALKAGKKVVAVPRLEGEHNHSQRELVEALEKEGYLLAVYDIADLDEQIKAAGDFTPKAFKVGNAFQLINEFIRNAFPDSPVQ